MLPDQRHINLEMNKAQDLKANQCGSITSHCWELLSHHLPFTFCTLTCKCLCLCQSTDHWPPGLLLTSRTTRIKLPGEHFSLPDLSSGADCGNISPCLQFLQAEKGVSITDVALLFIWASLSIFPKNLWNTLWMINGTSVWLQVTGQAAT